MKFFNTQNTKEKKEEKTVAVIMVMLVLYFILRNINQFSDIVNWIILLPVKVISLLTLYLNFKEDHAIIYNLITGLPLLMFYWLGWYKVLIKILSIKD